MENVESLVKSISEDLNDNEAGHAYIVWSAEQIRRWIIEAYNVIYDRRPDIFLERVVVQIEPCTIVQKCDTCGGYRSVLGESTADGRIIQQLKKVDKDAALDWTGKACAYRRTQRGHLKYYSIDTVGNTLYVWPEIPPTVKAYILVECAVRPEDTNIEVKDDVKAAIVQWVLYRARAMDAEVSASALQVASAHYNAFFTILNLPVESSSVLHSRG